MESAPYLREPAREVPVCGDIETVALVARHQGGNIKIN